MEKGKGFLYRCHWFVNILKNGLFWFGLRNRLAKIGLDLEPYFVEVEGLSQSGVPQIRDSSQDYKLERLKTDDIRKISDKIIGLNMIEFNELLARDPICIGLRYQDGSIAAYMLIETGSYSFKKRNVRLGPQEAYLQGMYTFEEHRGKNLAPYLRYKSYELLHEDGKARLYSITSYFNRSSLRFKQKLGVKHLSLRMSIALFKKWYWDFPLKKYVKSIPLQTMDG